MENVMFYEIGGFKFKLKRTSSGYYKLTEYNLHDLYQRSDVTYLFPNKEKALEEMLSHAEVDNLDLGEE